MKKIAVLESVPFSEEQKKRLSSLGDVEYCDYGEDIALEAAIEKTKNRDVVVVNWIDPSPFILSMKENSLVSLLSTGYGWIQNMAESRKKGVLVTNIPAYATEAVAEHIIGLLLSHVKGIAVSSNQSRVGKKSPPGSELKGKIIGIIGLGNIGSRVAELAQAFGMGIITYNRSKKHKSMVADVTLNELLSGSDIICITCPLNDQSRGLINGSNIGFVKHGAILAGATWGVVEEAALKSALADGRIGGVAYDLALEGSEKLQSTELLELPNFLCTFHNAYNTVEAAERQRDICINNIEMFLKGEPMNVVN